MRTCGASAGELDAAARPSASARSAVRNSPATPRTPSVPNSLRWGAGVMACVSARNRGDERPACGRSALRELRPLAGLLETRLLAFLLARVTREEAAPLHLGA